MLASKVLSMKLIHWPINHGLRVSTSTRSILFFSERKFSTEQIEEKKQIKVTPAQELIENWKPIYRFPKIRTVSALNKLKNYQLAATIVGIPITCFYFPEHLFTVGYTGSTLVLTLSLVSYLLKDSVGFIYINKHDDSLVRMAYLDFWGRRKDGIFEASDVVPFSDLPTSMSDRFYTKLKFNNEQTELKLLSKEVEILDSHHFTRIFGE